MAHEDYPFLTGRSIMATPGFGGKLLIVNLTSKKIIALDTEKYEQFGGGHGMATALFWDYCVAPGDWDLQDAFNPKNMVALITGPGKRDRSTMGCKDQCFRIITTMLPNTVVWPQ